MDEIAREGARWMLAAALRAESDSCVDALVDEVCQLVVRNSHAEPRRDMIAAQLCLFYDSCASATIEELHTLADMVETWWPEIAGFIDTDITNTKTEGHGPVKQVERLSVNRLLRDDPLGRA